MWNCNCDKCCKVTIRELKVDLLGSLESARDAGQGRGISLVTPIQKVFLRLNLAKLIISSKAFILSPSFSFLYLPVPMQVSVFWFWVNMLCFMTEPHFLMVEFISEKLHEGWERIAESRWALAWILVLSFTLLCLFRKLLKLSWVHNLS